VQPTVATARHTVRWAVTIADFVPPFRTPVVLLVDDDVDTLEMYSIGLGACGFDVLTAEDVEQARALACDREPDVVVTDARLPGASGVALAQALRADVRTSRCAIVLLTGDVALGEAPRPRPYDCFLTKPCTPQRLAQELVGLLVPRVPALEQ
jgi:CheY-like chemotaxis protein